MVEHSKRQTMEEETGKKSKIGLKRIKKKPNLNISKGNLKSISTPKKFSFLNMSVQKQSLRANNKALAQTLAKTRQDLRKLNEENQELKVLNQDLILELDRLKRLVGLKDEEVEDEVQKRMQKQMKDMKSSIDELTQNMYQSSFILNTLNEKYLNFSRRSTSSSRADSLGNVSVASDRLSLNQRGTASLRNKKQNSLMMKYLSSADEFSPPPGTDSPPFSVNKMNMTVIAEQSFLTEETGSIGHILSSNSISPVSENLDDVETATFKLPQRVLKGKVMQESTNSQHTDKETEKSSSTTSINDKHDKEHIAKQKSSKKTGINIETCEKKATDNVPVNVDNEPGILEFDMDFAELVSGSPLSKEKPHSTSAKDKAKAKDLSGTEKTTRKIFVVGKEQDKTQDTESKKNATKSTSLVSTKLPKVKSSSKLLMKKANKSKSPKAPSSEHSAPSYDIPVGYDTFNPFKPTKTLRRSPHKSPIPTVEISPASPEKKVDSLNFLASLREPSERSSKMVHLPVNNDNIAEQSNFMDENTIYFNSEMELTSVVDIAKLAQSSKTKTSPAGQQVDSKYNNMKDNPENGEKKDKTNKGNNSSSVSTNKGEKKENVAVTKTGDLQENVSSDTATVEMRNKKPGIFTFSVARKEADGTRKPVPEKTARSKSRSRSKKARNQTPEKEERKTGDDRDMFSFGDRTPTVPLEKLLQSKNVYDMSLNESSIAPTSSLTNYRQTSSQVSDNQHNSGHIYSVPLKGSPDEKNEAKSKGRSRSKSNTRSKSKSRQGADSDDDWVPERKARSRSRSNVRRKKELEDEMEVPSSKSRQSNTAETVSTQSESKSASDDQNGGHIYNVPLKDSPDDKKESISKGPSRSQSRTRSKSKSRQEHESDGEIVERVSERKSRSRSKKMNRDESIETNDAMNRNDMNNDINYQKEPNDLEKKDTYHVPLKDSPSEKSNKDNQSTRSKSRTRSKSKILVDEPQEEIVSEKLSRSARKQVVDDAEVAESTNSQTEPSYEDTGKQGNRDEDVNSVPLKDDPNGKTRSEDLKGRTRSRSKSTSRSKAKGVVLSDSEEEYNLKSESKLSSKTEFRKNNQELNEALKDTSKKKVHEKSSSAVGDVKDAEETTKPSKNVNTRPARSKSSRPVLDIGEICDDDIITKQGPQGFVETVLGKEDKKKCADQRLSVNECELNTDETSKQSNDAQFAGTTTYSVPVKDSSDTPRLSKRTRSKSRGSNAINYIEESDDEICEKIQRKSIRKSTRNGDKQMIVVSDSESEVEFVREKETVKSTKKKAKAKSTKSESTENNASEKATSGVQKENSGGCTKANLNKTFELDEGDNCKPIDDISENVSRKSVRKIRKTKDKQNIVITDSDSDIQSDVKNIEDKNSVNSVSPETVKSSFNFVNTSGRRKVNLNETFELDGEDASILVDKKSDTNFENVVTSINSERKNTKLSSKTPKVAPTSRNSKSARKTTQKKVKEGKDSRNTDTKTLASRNILLSDREEDKSVRLDTKTPAVTKSSNSIKSSKSTAGRSSRKRAGYTENEEQTPRTKKEKQNSEQKENVPSGLSTLEQMRKRLSMMASKQAVNNQEARKRSSIGFDDEDENGEDESDGAKRGRRARNQVSYVPLSLKAKLRQGDNVFDKQPSKAKADEMRLQLARKTSILKDVKN